MIAAALLLGAGAASSAQACAWYPPVNLAGAYAADLIVQGRVVAFTETAFDQAILRLEDVEALKGDASGTVQIAVLSAGPVDRMRREAGMQVIVAAADPSSLPSPLAERAGGLPLVQVPICANPFIVPATPENRAEIETSLATPRQDGDLPFASAP